MIPLVRDDLKLLQKHCNISYADNVMRVIRRHVAKITTSFKLKAVR